MKLGLPEVFAGEALGLLLHQGLLSSLLKVRRGLLSYQPPLEGRSPALIILRKPVSFPKLQFERICGGSCYISTGALLGEIFLILSYQVLISFYKTQVSQEGN